MPEVEIPEVGTVVFPETMSMDAIRAASADLHSRRLAYGPSPVDFMGEAARAAAPVFEANRRQGMQADMRAARTAQERADLTASLLGGAGAVLRPFASTPENPLGGFGSAARPVGAALNALGDESARIAGHVVGSYGGVLGPVGQDVARALPGVAAAMAGGPVLRAAGVSAELAPAAAFGAVPFAQTLDATGDTFAASKAGLTGAAIPGVAEAGRAAAAKTLGALVERGIIGTGASAAGNMGQKVVEALGAQGAIQVFMEGMNLPEYVAMTPEERQAALLHNLAVNSAFLMMDVPGVFSRSASQTRQGMKPAAKVGELMETLVNDPATVKALTDAADKFALDQMNVRENPRIAQLEAPPMELANVEPQFIDPSLPRPTMGQEVKVEAEPLISAPETKGTLERPSRTIEAPTSPPAESRVQPVSAPEAKAPEAARPVEAVPKKPARGTKEPTETAKARAGAKEFDRLVLEHGMQAGWVTAPEALYDETVDVKTGHGTGSIKAKILRQKEMARARRRAASEIANIAEIDLSNPAVRAQLAGKLKEWVDGNITKPQAQAEDFSKSIEQGPLKVPVSEMKVGDSLNIEGEPVRVVDISPDGDVTLQDGTRFGRQVMQDGSAIYAEEWTSGEASDAWLQEPSTPKLKGSQKQGDLLDSGDVEFNLFGERAQDGERIAQEKAQAEQAQREAAAFAAKHQQEFGINTGALGEAVMGGAKPTGPEASIERATLPRRIEGDTPGLPTDQPVSLQAIRQYLSTALDIPVRVRGFRQRAIGIFKQKPEAIRLKLINDLPTLAHEVGHYLHYILFPTGGQLTQNPRASNFGQRFDAELMTLGAATSRPSYTPHQVRKEGVAEFLREWLTDGAAAHAKAPGFATFFEAAVKKDFPEVWKILKTAQKDLRTYLQQPDAVKLDSVISVNERPADEPFSRLMQRMADNWINDLGPMERAMSTLQGFGLPPAQAKAVGDFAVNYIGGWRGKAQSDLFHGQADLNGRVLGKSLREILGGVEDLQDFRRYIVAKRMLEKSGHGKLVAADQPNIVQAARNVVAAGAAKHEARRKELLQFQRNARNLLVDAGLISKQQASRMDRMNEDYVPFHRVLEKLQTGAQPGSGEGFINLGQGIHAFKGSDRNIIDPLESIIKNTYLFRDLAERNRVASMFVDALEGTRGGGRVADAIAKRLKPVDVKHEEVVQMLKANGIDTQGLGLEDIDMAFKVWRMARQAKESEGIFTVWKDGQERPYQLDDPELYRALSLADATAAKIFNQFPLAKAGQFFTRTLRAGATLSPEFIARNPFRDQLTAAVYSKHGFIPFYDGFRGLLSAIGKDHWFQDWQRAGGRYSDFIAMDRTDLQSTLEQVVQEPSALAYAKELADPRNVLRNLQRFSELMEQATRISEFRRAKQDGASDVEAANASKEVTLNFARGGFRGKALNQISAFFNASVQDWNKMLREHNAVKDPMRAAQVASKAFLYITVPSLLAWYLGKDDKEIQNLPGWRKNVFWNINVRPLAELAGVEMDDFVMSFPKPFLLGQLYGNSVERALDFARDKDPNAVNKWFKSVLQSVPFHPQNLMPTAIRPAVETAANYSFFRGEPLENQGMQALPPEFRIAPGTSQVARELAQFLPWEYASPVRLDNLARGYFGSLAKYGTDAADYALAKVGVVDVPPAPEKTLWELPVLRAFTRSPYEASEYVRRFYDGYAVAEQRINALRRGPQFIDNARMRDWARQEGPALAFYLAPVGKTTMMGRLRAEREDLGEIVKAMAQVKNDRTMSPAEKASKLRTLASARDAMAEAAVKLYLAPSDQRKVH